MPISSNGKGKPRLVRNDGGFALVITLVLLAFLVLVLFAMTTMTRVETRMAGGGQQMHIARENAKMALNVALGQLQKYAGPDTVVTARADISSTFDQNPYWTGVWEDFAGNPRLVTWLVSGNEDPNSPTLFFPGPNANLNRGIDPFTQPNFHPYNLPGNWPTGPNAQYFIRLVGSGTTGDAGDGTGPKGEDFLHPNVGLVPGGVVVPRVPIFSRHFPGLPQSVNAGHVVGHYAYWVGDQGVKASVGLAERHLDVDAYDNDPTVDEKLRRLRQLSPQRFWFEGDQPSVGPSILLNYPQFDLTLQENEDLQKVLDYSQVRFALGSIPTDEFKDRFHDLTHMNYGVLASTEGSGLKVDLSYANTAHREFLDAHLNQLVSLQPHLGVATFEMYAPPSGSLVDGDPALVIGPVVSEMVVRYSVWQDEDSGDLQVQIEGEVELWNPYTVELDAADLLLRLTQLPVIEVAHNYSVTGTPRELDLTESLVHYIELPIPSIPAGAVIHAPVFVQTENGMEAGEPPVQINFPLTHPTDPTVTQPELEISSAGANIEVELWLFSGGLPMPANVDSAIDSLNLEPLGYFILDAFDPLPATTYPANEDTPKFGYNFRLLDAEDYPDSEWLTFYDPRTIGLENGGNIVALESDSDPLTAHTAILDDPGTPQLLVENTAAKLFELPLQESVSLGALQHLYYHREPAYALGNDWGGVNANINLDFDRYFLSTIPPTGNWDFPVPNTRIVPYRSLDDSGVERPQPGDLQSDYSAEHLLLQGMFNINSTSINAWRSVLGALNFRRDAGDNFDPDPGANLAGTWMYAAGNEPLESAVFRFPQTAHLQSQTYLDGPGIQSNPDHAYIQGVRELTEDQVFALAYEIVYLLRQNGEPFLSLSDFVESGIIQEAIDNLDFGTLSTGNPIPQNNASINGSIPPYSPAFITQGDIISLLAPFMMARSDTFVVRAYGDAHNPATAEIEARAYCEAIVQRVPATLDPSDDPIAPNGNFGRRFEIIYFRWLTPGEL